MDRLEEIKTYLDVEITHLEVMGRPVHDDMLWLISALAAAREDMDHKDETIEWLIDMLHEVNEEYRLEFAAREKAERERDEAREENIDKCQTCTPITGCDGCDYHKIAPCEARESYKAALSAIQALDTALHTKEDELAAALARAEKAERERGRFRKHLVDVGMALNDDEQLYNVNGYASCVMTALSERDTALARAEKAERERAWLAEMVDVLDVEGQESAGYAEYLEWLARCLYPGAAGPVASIREYCDETCADYDCCWSCKLCDWLTISEERRITPTGSGEGDPCDATPDEGEEE